MDFILQMQSVYRATGGEIGSRMSQTFQEYFKEENRLGTGWFRRAFLQMKMKSNPTDMHIFDSTIEKCIQVSKRNKLILILNYYHQD